MRRVINIVVALLTLVLLAWILLPPVAKVRDASARMSCQNNCKQLALACHNYLDAKGHTVPGTYPNPDLTPEQRLSWVYTLSPYTEQDFIQRKVDPSLPWDDDKNRPITGQQWLFFSCPASPNYRSDSRLSYLGVAGVGPDAATLPADDPRTGAFGYDRTLKWEEITDGTANTLLLLETRSGGPWAQGGSGTVRGMDPANRPHHGIGRSFDGPHGGEKWWQKPTSTTTMTMCDGSVRTLRDSVSPEVLEALATIRGKEEVPEEW